MKILVYSDVHIHPWQDGERPGREDDCLNVIDRVHDLAVSMDTDLVVFLGDLFESKRMLRADMVSEAYVRLTRPLVKNDGTTIRQIFLRGNHDVYRDACTLDPLHKPPERFVVRRTTSIGKLLFVPHGGTVDPTADYTVAFTHCDFKGVNHAPGVTVTEDALPGLRDKMGSRLCVINGHIHRPQKLVVSGKIPVFCVGAPIQHSWSDMDQSEKRGCITFAYDPKRGAITTKPVRHHFSEFPVFMSTPGKSRAGLDFVLRAIGVASDIETTTHDAGLSEMFGLTPQVLAMYCNDKGITKSDLGMYLGSGLKIVAGKYASADTLTGDKEGTA